VLLRLRLLLLEHFSNPPGRPLLAPLSSPSLCSGAVLVYRLPSAKCTDDGYRLERQRQHQIGQNGASGWGQKRGGVGVRGTPGQMANNSLPMKRGRWERSAFVWPSLDWQISCESGESGSVPFRSVRFSLAASDSLQTGQAWRATIKLPITMSARVYESEFQMNHFCPVIDLPAKKNPLKVNLNRKKLVLVHNQHGQADAGPPYLLSFLTQLN